MFRRHRTHRSVRTVPVLILAAALSAPWLPAAGRAGAADNSKRVIALDDHSKGHWLSDLRVSPDGRRAVIKLSFIDAGKDRYSADLWQLDLDDGVLSRLTTHPSSESNARFSPDGGRLAFIATRGGRAGVLALSFEGGEAAPLFRFGEDISEFAWFPDGERIVFAAKTPEDDKGEGGADRIEEDGRETQKSDVLIFTRTLFKSNSEGYLDGRHTHLWIADLESGEVRRLTDGDYDHSNPAVSPNGRFVAFVSNRTPDPDHNLNTDIFAIPTKGGSIIPVSSGPGAAANPRWSPGGEYLSFLEQAQADHYGSHRQVWLAESPRGGTIYPVFGEPRSLTEGLDLGVEGGSYGHGGDPYPVWSPDGKRLYVTLAERAQLRAYAVDVPDGNASLLIDGDRMVEHLQPTPDGRHLLFGLSDATHLSDIHISNRDGSQIRRLTHLNEDWFGTIEISAPERFSYRGFDDWAIEGWVVRPHRFREGTRYPTVLVIHGGPNWYYTDTYSFLFQLLAARGYVVVYTNPRGSTTYGQDFTDAVLGRYGLEDWEDIMTGLDEVIGRGWVDEDNLFVTGYSYGGMMTNWTITRTDRFTAAASGAGVADYGAAVGPDDDYIAWLAQFGGGPWDSPDNYRSLSPIFYMGNAKTPTLFLHGMADYRCPVPESERMYLALRLLGVETKLALFPDENHDFSNKPSHNAEYKRLILDWFDTHRR